MRAVRTVAMNDYVAILREQKPEKRPNKKDVHIQPSSTFAVQCIL